MENKNLVDKDLIEEEKSNYTLLDPSLSFLSTPQILKIFQKTPKQHIYTRPGKGGGNWEYVTGTYIKKVLNYTFGWLWDFEIVDHGKEGNQVWVKGKLTIKDGKGNTITKMQFGRADIKIKKGTNDALDFGNDLKAASTDALKKCASELGIASDIYGKEEFREIKPKEATEINETTDKELNDLKSKAQEEIPTVREDDIEVEEDMTEEELKKGGQNGENTGK